MALFRRRPGTATLTPPSRNTAPRVRCASFERAFLAGTLEGGALHYQLEGLTRSVTVALTWDALARLRRELVQAGRTYPDCQVVATVLRQWGKEAVEASLGD
jgi:hypothetical protein